MTSGQDLDASAAARITAIIDGLGDWRGVTLRRVRALMHAALPDVVEEIKWVKPSNPDGVPTWSQRGILCTGEVYEDKVKLTFAKGASLADPTGLFNSSLGGNTRRAIDLHEGDDLDADAFNELVQEAAAHNGASWQGK